MNALAIRIYIVVGIIALTYGGSKLAKLATEPPKVEMPAWTFRELPKQIGDWRGQDTELDASIAVKVGADVIVDRKYENDAGQTILMHTATFSRPDEGVRHEPINCYRGSGWAQLSTSRVDITISDDPPRTIPVAVTRWEKEQEGRQIIVLYWYQLGEHVVFSRGDLGWLRLTKMRGQEVWPALVKVMLEIPANDKADSRTDPKETVLGFAELIGKWLNEPEHQKYLSRWGGGE